MKKIVYSILFLFLAGCSSLQYLKYNKEEELRKNQEFDQKVVVKEIPAEEVPPAIESVPKSPAVLPPDQTKKVKPAQKPKLASQTNKVLLPESPKIRQPTIENADGFEPGSRRPTIDPFVVGEKVVHTVSYFGATAGDLTMETRPFLEVNGERSYNFYIGLKTSSLFSKFYSVDDYVQTFLSYETLLPSVFKINVRESGKLMQGDAFFDNKKNRAQYWEKKYTEKSGEEKKSLNWEILPYSQNAFSSVFYMRIFKWEIGKEYSFRVADDEKNIVFKATALEKTTLNTEAGKFNAIKLKANVISRGALAQSGAFHIWISDDDRKIILRMEAEIKIGKLVSEIVEYKSGL